MINRRDVRADLACAVLGCIMVWAYVQYLSAWSSDRIIGDLGDAFFNNFVLEHGYYWISGSIDSFWDGLFFYPEPNVLAFSDNHLGTLCLYVISRMLGFSPETSFQHWMVCISILNFLAAYYVFRKWRIATISALVIGLLFAFALPVTHKFGHIQLVPRFFIPFVFYYCDQFFKTGRIHFAGAAIVSFSLQMLCGIYAGFFTIVIAGLFSLVLFVRQTDRLSIFRRPLRDYWILALYLIPCVLVLFSLFRPYYMVSEKFGSRTWESIVPMIPYLETWLYTQGSVLYPFLSRLGKDLPMAHEHMAFMGFLLLLMIPCALVYLLRCRYKEADVSLIYACLFSAIATIVLFTQIEGYSLYYLVYHLPGFSALRAVSRVGIVLIFPLLLMLGMLLSALEKRKNKSRKHFIAFLLVCVFALLDQMVMPNAVVSYSKEESRRIRDEVDSMVPQGADGFYYFPVNSYPFYTNHIAAMFASLKHKIPTLNGYSGNFPPHFQRLAAFIYSGGAESVLQHEEEGGKGKVFYQIGYKTKRLEASKQSFSCQTVELSSFDYSLELIDEPVFQGSGKAVLSLRITNRSDEVFRSEYSGRYGLALSYRIAPTADFQNRILLPHDLSPGESAGLEVVVEGIKNGNKSVQFSMVQELVAWFHDRGQEIYEFELTDAKKKN